MIENDLWLRSLYCFTSLLLTPEVLLPLSIIFFQEMLVLP